MNHLYISICPPAHAYICIKSFEETANLKQDNDHLASTATFIRYNFTYFIVEIIMTQDYFLFLSFYTKIF